MLDLYHATRDDLIRIILQQRETIAALERRLVTLGELVHIRKETNRLEEVEQRLVHDWDEVQLVFRESGRDSRIPTTHPAPVVITERTCGSCGAPLDGARQAYCSPACRQRAYRQRHR